jgi:SNF2 family DNA or RNA helicase
MKATIFRTKQYFANEKNIPILFAAIVLKETEKAAYVYGQGTTEVTQFGICMRCGRKLTHPVSVALGIGPECGGHWHNWDAIGGYNEENIGRLKKAVAEIKVDCWLPKTALKEMGPSDLEILYPGDHPLFQKSTTARKEPQKKLVDMLPGEAIPTFKVTFPFNEADLNTVKGMPNRRWDSTNHWWTLPADVHRANELLLMGFEHTESVREWIKEETATIFLKPVQIETLKGALRPFQQEGVAFLQAKKGRALIGDEMGLGKTVQALAWLEANPQARPAVIVVPASLKLNWEREARKWMSQPRTQVISGRYNPAAPLHGDIVIINYDILANARETTKDRATGKKVYKVLPGTGWVDHLVKYGCKAVILDEAHNIKESSTFKTQDVKKLCKKAAHLIALTGTPIINRPIELYNVFSLIKPGMFANRHEFGVRYCAAKHDGFGWNYSGASNTEELYEKLKSTIMLRRLKKDVLKELPAKTRTVIPLEIQNETEYKKAQDDMISWIRQTKGQKAAERASGAEALVRLEMLKQLAVAGKTKEAVAWIHQFMETSEKLILFGVHQNVIAALTVALKRYNPVVIDGNKTATQRQAAVDAFQNDPSCRIFIGNIKAAGVGLTLTAASAVAFLELGWTPGEHDQAEDRAHRIGQRDNVQIFYLLAENTIEEDIATMLDAKRENISRAIDGQEAEENTLLTNLLNNLAA